MNDSESADPRARLLKELADPLRLRIVDRLAAAGPATVTELADRFGVGLPKLSNHLRRLREAGLVAVDRRGRHAVYRLADPGLEALMPLLDRLTGRVERSQTTARPRDVRRGRTCYDHLGGALGVALYRSLLERGALLDNPDGTVSPGDGADEALRHLGVSLSATHGKRRLAFECLDAREHDVHLAGVLGDRLLSSLLERVWIERDDPTSRDVHLTRAGARALREFLPDAPRSGPPER
jgi:DNA-binding transcriptional ArsR family regulator